MNRRLRIVFSIALGTMSVGGCAWLFERWRFERARFAANRTIIAEEERAARAESSDRKRIEERERRLMAELREPGPTTERKPAERTLVATAHFRSMLSACYDDAISKFPTAHGTVTVTLSFAPSGRTSTTEVLQTGDLPKTISPCMRTAAKNLRLPEDARDLTRLELVFGAE